MENMRERENKRRLGALLKMELDVRVGFGVLVGVLVGVGVDC